MPLDIFNLPGLDAVVASARTQREETDVFDHKTTTAFAPLSAISIASSQVCPARKPSSHHTENPSLSNA